MTPVVDRFPLDARLSVMSGELASANIDSLGRARESLGAARVTFRGHLTNFGSPLPLLCRSKKAPLAQEAIFS